MEMILQMTLKYHLIKLQLYNPKTLSNGENVVQLEVTMGSDIKSVSKENVKVICVQRDRFLPVKKCQDLFLIKIQ